MNYEQMSDFEINKLVAEALPFTQVVGTGEYPSVSESAVHVERKKFKYGNVEECGVDYCNNPSAAWPIILENKIDIFFEDSSCIAAKLYLSLKEDICVENRNPLRSAMIVYLMMQEQECNT